MIRLFLILFFSFHFVCATDPYPRNYSIDITHYRFEISLTDKSNVIAGRSEISILFREPVTQFSLDLVGKSTGQSGMEVSKVSIKKNPIVFSHNNEKLILHLPTAPKVGETIIFEIEYAGVPADGLIISTNKFGDRTFFGDNWPNRAHHWLPTIDHPYDKATCEFIVEAPDHYQVIANGVKAAQVELPDSRTRTHWKESKEIPTKVMVIGVARFAIDTPGVVNEIPVETWVYPQNKEAGFSDFSVAPEILEYFASQIGPFPFQKLANVQSTTRYGGMENASAIFYFENSVTGNSEREGLIAHEIAHQWFGDSASEADWYHVWLSEGFATYFTNLHFEHKYGRERLVQEMKSQREEVVAYFRENPAPVVDTTLTNINRVLSTNTYQKGGWVLHMLRHKVGDEAFWNGIRAYYKKYDYDNALTNDFRKEMEVASGKDLAVFFQQWLREAGHPVLDVKWSYDPRKKVVDVSVEQTQEPVFKTPLEIGLQDENGAIQIKAIELSKKSQKFSIPAPKRPVDLILDPNTWLLFEGKISTN